MPAGIVNGQTRSDPKPYATIQFMGGLQSVPVSRGVDFWSPSSGAGVTVATPFYAGDLELGFTLLPWTASAPGLPDFYSGFFFGGWSFSSGPGNAVRATAGIHLGNFFMAFDSQQIQGERNESEFAVSPFVRLRRSVLFGVEGFVEVGAIHVYTAPQMDLLKFSFGLTFEIEAPAWFREVLQ